MDRDKLIMSVDRKYTVDQRKITDLQKFNSEKSKQKSAVNHQKNGLQR